MDDYKRGLYMEARRLIESGEELYVCSALMEAVDSWYYTPVSEIFPEFAEMFDGYVYYENGRKHFTLSYMSWWAKGWKEPRLRAIDCLLRD